MNQDLQNIFNDFVKRMKITGSVLGAWNFGSSVHGTSDEYSDVDIIFLIDGKAFKGAEGECSAILLGLCDEIVLCFEEAFNSDAIISNGYLLKKDDQILQFDIVLINEDYIRDPMCKVFYTDISEDDIIFDTDEHVKRLCADCPHGKLWRGKTERFITNYLFYFHMTAKYLNRKDYFKLNHAMRTLYDTHVALLLTGYDAVKWGGAESKLHYIDADKQEHLKKYYCTDDFLLNRKNLLKSMEWFEEDVQDVLEKRKKTYNMECVTSVKEYWKACTGHMS